MTPASARPSEPVQPPQETRGAGFTTRGTWFGPAERPLAGWWTVPDRPSCDGVIIAPPLGYEYWSAHRSLRTLGETLARAGWNVLRFDWDGSGDSAGEASDPDRVAAWRASLAHAVGAMREASMERVALIGLRLGATLALLDAAAFGIDEVVACAPVGGRRFVRELKMLGIADPACPGGVMYSGLVISADTAADLEGIDPETTAPPAVSRSLIVARSASGCSKLVAALRADRRPVEVHECPQMQDMLERPTGDAKLPEGFVGKIAAWLGEGRAAAGTPVPAALQTIDMPWRGKGLRETFTRVAGLAALLSTPRDARLDTVVVFLNSGAEPHIGPGRAWVEYARALASRGHACLRTDFSGWGESPDEGHRPGRPYDEHCVPDTLRIVAALRGRYRRIVLAGLCAGAWVALKAAQQIRVDGVFALNPQLYWKPGLPVIIRDPEAFEWRTPMRERHRKAARWQLWSFLDLLGIRPMAAHWLTALRKNRTRVILSFAAGDDGLVFLRDRCARRLARELRCGYLTVEETAGIDHQMYRLWMRPAIVEQMAHFLEALPATPDDGVKIKP